jgi:PAS domain S-box-containing protein
MYTGRKRDISRPVEHMRPEELGIGELFGRIREAVIVADATTQRIVLWNPAATNIFGYSISEALELNIEKLVPEPLKAQHRAGITRYAETGHGPYIDSRKLLELPALTKSGDEIYVELSLSPIGLVDDTNGGRRFVLVIVRDVTERKRAEEALRQNEERFRLLVEGVKDYAIFMLDPEGKVASWNEGAHRINGYRQQEILGRHFSVFYPEEDLKRSKPERELEIAQEKGTYEEEGWRVRKDGSRFWASVLITALWDEAGGLRGFA